jgi:hypothetical protein
MPDRISGFRGEFLWEWDIVEHQLTQLANSYPPADYEWRPDATARGVSEIMVHISCGTFMLLECMGVRVPADLYAELPEQPQERLWEIVRRNDELEHGLRQKDKVIPLLNRALQSARNTIELSDDAEIERSVIFFGENTTIRRVYLRLLAHSHEHMGQLIGYTRMRKMPAPWPDWRPDRRSK